MDERELMLHRRREVALSGAGPMGQRRQIAASWRRVAACGLDPGAAPQIPPLPAEEVERRRVRSGLADLIPRLTGHLSAVIEAGQMVVVADNEGRVLWRRGQPRIKREADRLGFVGGSAWTEGNVGTNAIGTALVLGAPVHVRGPEHFADSHTRWGCAAAPLVDPWSGCTLGVVDVSGPSLALHPTELAVVTMAARLAALELRDERAARLEQLRAVAAPVLARVRGKVVVVDPDGHVAAVSGVAPPGSVSLPKHMRVGTVWLPTLGEATAEVLPGGWLLRLGRPAAQEGTETEIVLDLSGSAPELQVSGPSGCWQRVLSPRHAEIVVALLGAERGRTPAELAADLFADPTRVVTVRAEMSRLRRIMGALLESRPYRLADGVTGRLLLPDPPAQALPTSSAPAITRLRADT